MIVVAGWVAEAVLVRSTVVALMIVVTGCSAGEPSTGSGRRVDPMPTAVLSAEDGEHEGHMFLDFIVRDDGTFGLVTFRFVPLTGRSGAEFQTQVRDEPMAGALVEGSFVGPSDGLAIQGTMFTFESAVARNLLSLRVSDSASLPRTVSITGSVGEPMPSFMPGVESDPAFLSGLSTEAGFTGTGLLTVTCAIQSDSLVTPDPGLTSAQCNDLIDRLEARALLQ